jgi:hypothetical protein
MLLMLSLCDDRCMQLALLLLHMRQRERAGLCHDGGARAHATRESAAPQQLVQGCCTAAVVGTGDQGCHNGLGHTPAPTAGAHS